MNDLNQFVAMLNRAGIKCSFWHIEQPFRGYTVNGEFGEFLFDSIGNLVTTPEGEEE